MGKLIYFDNAATTWPKPYSVVASMTEAMQKYGGNPGRGSHKLSVAAAETVYDCRLMAAKLFHSTAENVVFTVNATTALNMAIKGLVNKGAHILIDNFAHNASYRPVMSLVNKSGCLTDFYDTTGTTEEILFDIEKKITAQTSLLVLTHQSNICSHTAPISEIGELCRKHGILFVVDASQSAGHLPIDMQTSKISALCVPGHKGLWGPMGVGMLLAGDGVTFRTILEGGAGILSTDVEMPDDLPERLEAGTVPYPAIAGLLAGMRYVEDSGIEAIREHERELSALFMEEIQKMSHISVFGETDGSVVGFTVRGHSPAEVGAYLSDFGICVRSGYHCAPIAHKTVGTYENGSVRVSFSHRNKEPEVLRLTKALKKLEN